METQEKQSMEDRGHCPISGSKIARFFACPTSFWPTPDDIEDTQSRAAAEGERAHGFAERAVGEVKTQSQTVRISLCDGVP